MDVAAFTRGHIALFLAALALTVGVLMLTGKIHMRGLLRDKSGGGLSPMRIQLLVVTLTGAAAYYSKVVEYALRHETSLPPPSTDLLIALGGSHVLYLAGKTASVFDLASKFLNRRN